MSSKTFKIIDTCRTVVATAEVTKRGDRFAGRIDLTPMPSRLRQQFEEYEEIVNGQVFSLLDEIEQQISNFALKVVLEDGSEAALTDLQVYPSTGRVSFKIVKQPAESTTPA